MFSAPYKVRATGYSVLFVLPVYVSSKIQFNLDPYVRSKTNEESYFYNSLTLEGLFYTLIVIIAVLTFSRHARAAPFMSICVQAARCISSQASRPHLAGGHCTLGA